MLSCSDTLMFVLHIAQVKYRFKRYKNLLIPQYITSFTAVYLTAMG